MLADRQARPADARQGSPGYEVTATHAAVHPCESTMATVTQNSHGLTLEQKERKEKGDKLARAHSEQKEKKQKGGKQARAHSEQKERKEKGEKQKARKWRERAGVALRWHVLTFMPAKKEPVPLEILHCMHESFGAPLLHHLELMMFDHDTSMCREL